MLDRNIQIFDNFRIVSDLVDQLIVKLVRIQIMQADPFDAFDLREFTAQLGQAVPAVEVRSIECNILGNDDQFSDAMCGEIGCLFQDVLHRAGTVSAADVWNGAESAEIAAALRNAQIGPTRPGSDNAPEFFHRCTVAAKGSECFAAYDALGSFNNVSETAHSQNGVDLRQFLQNGILVALRKAACDNDPAQMAALFQLGHLKNVVDRFAFGGINKAAGVDNDKVCPVCLRHEHKARLVHQIKHLFAVDEVFRAPQRDHRKCFFHQKSSDSS